MKTTNAPKGAELTPLAEAKEQIDALLCPQNPEEWTPYSFALVEKLITHFPQTEDFLVELCELKLHSIESALSFLQREPEMFEDELFDVLFLTFMEIGEILSFVEDEAFGQKAVDRINAIISTIGKMDKEHGEAFAEAAEEMLSDEDDEDECDECDDDECEEEEEEEEKSCSSCCGSKRGCCKK